MLQHPWFIYGRASVVKDEICLQYGCKQAWMYETRKRHEKILHKKYLERSDVHLATRRGGGGEQLPRSNYSLFKQTVLQNACGGRLLQEDIQFPCPQQTLTKLFT